MRRTHGSAIRKLCLFEYCSKTSEDFWIVSVSKYNINDDINNWSTEGTALLQIKELFPEVSALRFFHDCNDSYC